METRPHNQWPRVNHNQNKLIAALAKTYYRLLDWRLNRQATLLRSDVTSSPDSQVPIPYSHLHS